METRKRKLFAFSTILILSIILFFLLIIIILTTIIRIAQITSAFTTYSMKQLEFDNQSLNRPKEIFSRIKAELFTPDFEISKPQKSDEISSIYIISNEGRVIMAENAELVGRDIEVNPLSSYRFPLGNRVVVMDISVKYQRKMVTKILLDLLTV